MERYDSKQEWTNVGVGESKLLGFQQVLSNKDKVFVWFREKVNYPESQDRHRTTREMNNSQRIPNWAKSVWLKTKVIEVLSYQLSQIGVSYQDLINLEDDSLSDKWATKSDGFRNFVKAELINPYCEKTRRPLRIQISQSSTVPESIYKRAQDEAALGIKTFKALFDKYEKQSRIQMYTPVHVNRPDMGLNLYGRELCPVYTIVDGRKVYVYEESEIVIGEPSHKFVEYYLENYLDSVQIETSVKAISEDKVSEKVKVPNNFNTSCSV